MEVGAEQKNEQKRVRREIGGLVDLGFQSLEENLVPLVKSLIQLVGHGNK